MKSLPVPIPDFSFPSYTMAEIHPTVFCAPTATEALKLRFELESPDDLFVAEDFLSNTSFINPEKCKNATLHAAAAESEMQTMLVALSHVKSLTTEEYKYLFIAINRAFARVGLTFLTPEQREEKRKELKLEVPEMETD